MMKTREYLTLNTDSKESADCCITAAGEASHSGHQEHAGHGSGLGGAASATVHCLTGCAIGEFVGLAIGAWLGLAVWPTIILATVLAFISGYALTLIPFVKRGVPLSTALKTVWLGELVSISAMEVAMNFTDYHMGGMTSSGLADPIFWLGYGGALVAGFAAGLPVNYWLLRRNLKACH